MSLKKNIRSYVLMYVMCLCKRRWVLFVGRCCKTKDRHMWIVLCYPICIPWLWLHWVSFCFSLTGLARCRCVMDWAGPILKCCRNSNTPLRTIYSTRYASLRFFRSDSFAERGDKISNTYWAVFALIIIGLVSTVCWHDKGGESKAVLWLWGCPCFPPVLRCGIDARRCTTFLFFCQRTQMIHGLFTSSLPPAYEFCSILLLVPMYRCTHTYVFVMR